MLPISYKTDNSRNNAQPGSCMGRFSNTTKSALNERKDENVAIIATHSASRHYGVKLNTVNLNAHGHSDTICSAPEIEYITNHIENFGANKLNMSSNTSPGNKMISRKPSLCHKDEATTDLLRGFPNSGHNAVLNYTECLSANKQHPSDLNSLLGFFTRTTATRKLTRSCSYSESNAEGLEQSNVYNHMNPQCDGKDYVCCMN